MLQSRTRASCHSYAAFGERLAVVARLQSRTRASCHSYRDRHGPERGGACVAIPHSGFLPFLRGSIHLLMKSRTGCNPALGLPAIPTLPLRGEDCHKNLLQSRTRASCHSYEYLRTKRGIILSVLQSRTRASCHSYGPPGIGCAAIFSLQSRTRASCHSY